MSKPDTACVKVDPTNPGQFFACCGLLELAERLWGGAEAWFANEKFHLEGRGTLTGILNALVAREAQQIAMLENGLPVRPLIAPLKLSFDGERPFDLLLDTWMTIRLENGRAVAAANPPWNFWSGQQTSFRIWRDLRTALEKQLAGIRPEHFENLFALRVMLSGRFGFDPDRPGTHLMLGSRQTNRASVWRRLPLSNCSPPLAFNGFGPRYLLTDNHSSTPLGASASPRRSPQWQPAV